MSIAKGRSLVRGMSDDYCLILGRLIGDIRTYAEMAEKWDVEAEEYAKENSDGDCDVYWSLRNCNDYKIQFEEDTVYIARKILFCAVFTYYETMLHLMLPVASKAEKIGEMYVAIEQDYKEKYGSELQIANKSKIATFYRPIRNHFIHGNLKCIKEKEKIDQWSGNPSYKMLKYNKGIMIEEDSFLNIALEDVKTSIESIEDAYSAARRKNGVGSRD